MDDILPAIPVNTSLDSKLVLNLDAEFVSTIDNNGDVLGQGKLLKQKILCVASYH